MMQLIAYDIVNSPDALVGFSGRFHVSQEFVINPTLSEMEESDIDCIIAGTKTTLLWLKEKCMKSQRQKWLMSLKKLTKLLRSNVNFNWTWLQKSRHPSKKRILSRRC